MRRQIVSSSVLLVAAVAVSSAQSGAKSSNVCALLTAKDISAAVGGSAGQSHETSMGASPGCMWGPTEGQGMVTYSVFALPQGAQREQGLAKLREVTERLKQKGWKEDKAAIAGGSCSMLTPPPSEKDAPVTTGCLAEAKGMGVAVSYLGKKSLAIENVKALLEKLVTQLP
jgi:hypothetical protein